MKFIYILNFEINNFYFFELILNLFYIYNCKNTQEKRYILIYVVLHKRRMKRFVILRF